MRNKLYSFVLSAAMAALWSSCASAAVLFSDNFNSVLSAANYTSATNGETAVTHAFDYSTMGIPAPRPSQADTLGVKFEANMTSGVPSAVTLHTIQQFSGRYRVMFDGWINANGPFPGGGGGSTEFLTAGVGGDGVSANQSGSTGSGAWTAVDGEGGSGIDYRLFRNAGSLEGVAGGSYAAGTHSTARNATDPYYSQFGAIDVANLPVQGVNNGGPAQQTGTTLTGAFGFEWHQVEIRVDSTGGTGGAPIMSWYIDGLRIGTLDAGSGTAFPTNGSVAIGYMDIFTSLSDNASLSFGLIDNLKVVPEPSAAVLCLVGAIGFLTARRRR